MNLTINIKGKLISLEKPIVMGVLNVTNDSFYATSRVANESSEILKRAEILISEGATILDIGGYSSRPGALDISLEEELARVIPAVQIIKNRWPDQIISIDTFRSKVIKEAVDMGADICNDISAGALDDKMFDTVANLNIPYIIMHMKGSPQNMKELAHYKDILSEIVRYFEPKIAKLHDLGIKDLIIDPGFGFAKNIEQNFYLLKNLRVFEIFEKPILAGLSRKSMIYKTLNIDASKSLNGTTALNMIALQNGARILRVHDVKEAIETISLYNKYHSATIY